MSVFMLCHSPYKASEKRQDFHLGAGINIIVGIKIRNRYPICSQDKTEVHFHCTSFAFFLLG